MPDLTYRIPPTLFVVQACSFMLRKDIDAAPFYMNQKYSEGRWVPPFAALDGSIRTVAALGGALAARLLDPPRNGQGLVSSELERDGFARQGFRP